jgi:hypothetical protein
MTSPFEEPEWRWEPWRLPTVVLAQDLTRVVTDKDDPEFEHRPVGFTASLEREKPKPPVKRRRKS